MRFCLRSISHLKVVVSKFDSSPSVSTRLCLENWISFCLLSNKSGEKGAGQPCSNMGMKSPSFHFLFYLICCCITSILEWYDWAHIFPLLHFKAKKKRSLKENDWPSLRLASFHKSIFGYQTFNIEFIVLLVTLIESYTFLCVFIISFFPLFLKITFFLDTFFYHPL